MKRFKYIFRVILAVILINLTTGVKAQDSNDYNAADISVQNNRVNENAKSWLDSVDISLLTCGPGQEVWSYYGHTALRIHDKMHGTDVAVNWGMFSFRQGFFVLRFVFGLTDYQMGIFPMSDFLSEYAAEGRWVRQQRLRLSRDEKLNIMHAIDENAKPENVTYRYNFFYDNCTTRVREMILDNIGKDNTIFDANEMANSTYREEIHKLNGNHRWARFGNDLLLGYGADVQLNKREWEFLPDNLSKDFETEGRKDFVNTPNVIDGTSEETVTEGNISLIDSTTYLIPQSVTAQASADQEPITPIEVGWVMAVIIVAISVIEAAKKKNYWGLDAFLLVITGLPGLILLTMVFSQHPTVQVNFQILILNPLNIVFAWKTIKRMRKGKLYWYFDLYGIFLAAGLLLRLCQHYAEGITILALSLLIRYIIKSTFSTMTANKFAPAHYIGKKFRKKRYKIKNI